MWPSVTVMGMSCGNSARPAGGWSWKPSGTTPRVCSLHPADAGAAPVRARATVRHGCRGRSAPECISDALDWLRPRRRNQAVMPDLPRASRCPTHVSGATSWASSCVAWSGLAIRIWPSWCVLGGPTASAALAHAPDGETSALFLPDGTYEQKRRSDSALDGIAPCRQSVRRATDDRCRSGSVAPASKTRSVVPALAATRLVLACAAWQINARSATIRW